MPYDIVANLIVGTADVDYRDGVPADLVTADRRIGFTRFTQRGCHVFALESNTLDWYRRLTGE